MPVPETCKQVKASLTGVYDGRSNVIWHGLYEIPWPCMSETCLLLFKAWSRATVSDSAVFSQVWEHHCAFCMHHLNSSDICVGCFPFINIGELHLLPWWLVRCQRQIKFPWARSLPLRLFELELGALAALWRGSENHHHKNYFYVSCCAPLDFKFDLWLLFFCCFFLARDYSVNTVANI